MTVHAILNESTGEVEVTDEMHELLDGMVEVLESADYKIKDGLTLPEFIEAVEHVIETDTDLDEGKKAALVKAHGTVKAVVAAAKPGALKVKAPVEQPGADNADGHDEYEKAPKCAKCEGCECQNAESVTEQDVTDDAQEESSEESEEEEGEEEPKKAKKANPFAKKGEKAEKEEEEEEDEEGEDEEDDKKEESVKSYSKIPGWAKKSPKAGNKVQIVGKKK